MPNGRRGPDWAKQFADEFCRSVQASKKYKLKQRLGATSCWEGEDRIIITTDTISNIPHKPQKVKPRNIYIHISEYAEWERFDKAKPALGKVKKLVEDLKSFFDKHPEYS